MGAITLNTSRNHTCLKFRNYMYLFNIILQNHLEQTLIPNDADASSDQLHWCLTQGSATTANRSMFLMCAEDSRWAAVLVSRAGNNRGLCWSGSRLYLCGTLMMPCPNLKATLTDPPKNRWFYFLSSASRGLQFISVTQENIDSRMCCSYVWFHDDFWRLGRYRSEAKMI